MKSSRRRRNLILLWLIAGGLLNFILYTISYAYIGGDAKNGHVQNNQYYVKGHFLRHGKTGYSTQVSRMVWIYSYIHSISIWPTIGLVLCSMLILARPHIIATIPEDSFIQGQHFVTATITTIIIITAASMLYFVMDLVSTLSAIDSADF